MPVMQTTISLLLLMGIGAALVLGAMKIHEQPYSEMVDWRQHYGYIVKVIGITQKGEPHLCTGILIAPSFVVVPTNCTHRVNPSVDYDFHNRILRWTIIVPWLTTIGNPLDHDSNWHIAARKYGCSDIMGQWALLLLLNGNLTSDEICPPYWPNIRRIARLPLRPNLLESAVLDLDPMGVGVNCSLVGFDSRMTGLANATAFAPFAGLIKDKRSGRPRPVYYYYGDKDPEYNNKAAQSFIDKNKQLRRMPVKLVAPMERTQSYFEIWNVQYRSVAMQGSNTKIIDIGTPLVCHFPDIDGDIVMGVVQGLVPEPYNGSKMISQIDNDQQFRSESEDKKVQFVLSLFVYQEFKEFIACNNFSDFISEMFISYSACKLV